MAPESPAYNIGSSFVIRAELDVPALKNALQALIRCHPMLRTSFSVGGEDKPIQHIHADPRVDFAQNYLYGWPYGGPIAFEMAHRLRSDKREVVLLALVPHFTLFLVLSAARGGQMRGARAPE